MHTLADFDGHLLDGLNFCAQAYAMFEEIRAAADGPTRLRLRPSRLERKLLDEILPICNFLQSQYKLGRYISVRWIDGGQNYDAEVVEFGYYVDNGEFPAASFLEVTCAVHPNEYLVRELLETKGGGFGLDGIRRLKGREIESIPVVHSGLEFVESFSRLVVSLLEKKAKKSYPAGTVLLVECTLDTIYMPNEWNHLVSLVKLRLPQSGFREIHLIETQRRYSHTFYPSAEA